MNMHKGDEKWEAEMNDHTSLKPVLMLGYAGQPYQESKSHAARAALQDNGTVGYKWSLTVNIVGVGFRPPPPEKTRQHLEVHG